MLNYIFRRVVYGFLVLVGVNILTFVLFFAVNTPDDMARMIRDELVRWPAVVKAAGITPE